MNYLQIINLIFGILFGTIGLFYCHFLIFAVVGMFKKRKYPHTDEKLTYGIMIACRNEENVIANLLDSIHNTDYPQEKLKVFVIAHNCTDRTAEIARTLGANVIEYNNPNEKTKGYALKYGFEQIKELHLGDDIDGYHIFDADNILNKDYFTKMNDAFVACDKQSIVTSFRNSKNFGTNILSGMYGIYFTTGCRFEMRGRTALGCSTRVSGTGYLFNASVVAKGWQYVTLTEDWELTADQIIDNHKVVYCDDAELFDEQPTKFKIMWRQRVRWSRGHLLICVTRLKDLVKSFFGSKKKHQHKVSLYDMIQNILPFCLVLTTLGILQFVLTLFAPLAGISIKVALLTWLKSFGWTCLCSYIGMFLQGSLVFIAERKRIKNVSLFRKIVLSFIWPLFVVIQFPIDVVALFKKNVGWKTIPHTDTTRYQDLGIESKTDANK